MKKYKQHITFVFLILFISIKIAGLHILNHHHDDEHHEDCDVCEFVFISNATPVLTNIPVLFEPFTQHSYDKQLFYNYYYSYSKNYTSNALFCRPPPC